MAITIVGLGPGNPAHVTREAWEILSGAAEVYLRTSRHPTVDGLPAGVRLQSFDTLYETVDDFGLLYDRIAEQIVELGRRPQGVIYAVPGHPLVGESSVLRILSRAAKEGLSVRMVDGLSFVEPVLGLVKVDGLTGLQLADATDLAAAHHPALDPDRPALIGQLYGRRLASDLKLTLMSAYPDDHRVTIVRAAGTAQASTETLPLHTLDQGAELDHLTSLYVPPLPRVSSLPGFQETVARLRAPGGCPWDREQTHQSLGPHLLEETYEVLAALDSDDPDDLREELGDLLMQIAMHVQIATEEGTFRFADVIGQIDGKLKRRHPHVFGDLHVEDSAEVLRNWEAIKREEGRARREAAGRLAQREGGDEVGEPAIASSLSSLPVTLPALARAQSLGERAARAGFDWPDVGGVLQKLAEEVGELASALRGPRPEQTDELGDVLFTLVNLARWLGIDAETALRSTNDRFVRRYSAMERQAHDQGVILSELGPRDQNDLWEWAKQTGAQNSTPQRAKGV